MSTTTRANNKKQLGKSTTPGSLLISNDDNEFVPLAPGSEGQVAMIISGKPGYGTPNGSATLKFIFIDSPTTGTTAAFTATGTILSSLAYGFFRNGWLMRPTVDYTVVFSGATATITVIEAFETKDTNLAFFCFV